MTHTWDPIYEPGTNGNEGVLYTNGNEGVLYTNGNEGVLYTPQISRTGTLSSYAVQCHTKETPFLGCVSYPLGGDTIDIF